MNPVFNKLISKTIKSKITDSLALVNDAVGGYFNLNNQVDVYFSLEIDEEQDVTLTGESYESGVIICRLFRADFDEQELLNFLFHELNHARKNELFSTQDDPTLFNWMLLEGLAQCFEEQVEHDLGFNWNKYKIKNDQPKYALINGLRKIIEISENDLYWNYYDWFYNFDQKNEMPVNFAYKIGQFLISEFCLADKIRPSDVLSVSNTVLLNFARRLACEK